jgi:butyrate kinase
MTDTQLLIIYPQDYCTKIAIYQNINVSFLKIIKHKKAEIDACNKVVDQLVLRKEAIIQELKDNEVDLQAIVFVIGRGGLIKPLSSGVYEVNQRMIEDLSSSVMGQHAINLGGLLAHEMLSYIPKAKAFIADPVVVDELADVARITGHPMFERKSVFHASNHKYIARKYAQSITRRYEELNLIIAHMGGGGVSIGVHQNGRVIDVNQAFDGEGPFALTRTGTLPAGDLVRLCFSGKYTEAEILKIITHEGGLMAHLGTDSVIELEKRIKAGDKKSNFIAEALSYQVAKEIGAMSTVLKGNIDAIILSGEFFNCSCFSKNIIERIEKLGKIILTPTVHDLDSLAYCGELLLANEIEVLEYQ